MTEQANKKALVRSTLRLSEHVELEIVERDGLFAGLGQVWCGGTPLRCASLPLSVEIRTPDAVALTDYRLLRTTATQTGITLDFSMQRQDSGLMEWMLHEVRPVRRVADWSQPPQPAADTSLRLELQPVSRTLDGRVLHGFTYQYRYRSASLPIYQILDRGSWEPGGTVLGNTFLLRSCFSPSVVKFRSADDFYSSEWYLPHAANPHVFQFLPFQTELSGFTFTTGAAGTLVTWATEVAHIRSLFEKHRGQDALLHLHEHSGDLAREFATAPMEVLFLPGNLDAVDRLNLHEACRELVSEHLHAQIGMRRERVTPYGMIEEWSRADLPRYGSEALPALLDAGVRKVALANLFQNNMNVWGVSNMCCTVDYRMPSSGDEEALRAFCAAAHAGGAKVEMWANTAISTLTEILRRRNGTSDRIRHLPAKDSIQEVLDRADSPYVRTAAHAIDADHYTPVFAVLNLRDETIRAYWLERWRAAREQMGLDGFFLDSSFNLSSDKFHWVRNPDVAEHNGATADQTHLLGGQRPAALPGGMILSQYRAHLDLVVEMQRLGYEYNSEDLGVFGIHRHGPGVAARLDSLSLWSDCIAWFDAAAIRKAGADADDVFFRGLAYRMMWALSWDHKAHCLSLRQEGLRSSEDAPTAQQIALLRAYSTVEPYLQSRHILPREDGVVYAGQGKTVLWAFRDLEYPLPALAHIRDVLTGSESHDNRVTARRHSISLVTLAP